MFAAGPDAAGLPAAAGETGPGAGVDATPCVVGPGAAWLNNSFDGVPYEIFWCLFVSLFLPRIRPWRIASGVLAATCGLEFMQLWHPSFLEALRRSFLGAAILGTTFDWADFPWYFVGSGAGWLWLEKLCGRRNALQHASRAA